jgi:conjugal transfer pilus assembly protein TraI
LRYPPQPIGFPAAPIQTLLDDQADRLHEIRRSRGLSGKHNDGGFERPVLAPVRHYAALVHLLPVSDKASHRGPGGLFRFGLDCAFHTHRHAESRMMARGPIEQLREEEALWAQAAFLAGLFCEAVHTLSRVSVYSNDGQRWHPGAQPLWSWLVEVGATHYFIDWVEHDDPLMRVAVGGAVLPSGQARLLAEGDRAILGTLADALAHPDSPGNPLVGLFLNSRNHIAMADLAADPSRYGPQYNCLRLEPMLIDAMRHLFRNKKWLVNKESKARVWVGEDGVFLIWPAAGHDMQADLRESNVAFIPRDMVGLAELMANANIIVRTPTGCVTEIAVPRAGPGVRDHHKAVRLSRPEILFEGAEPPPSLGVRLLAGPPIESAPAAARAVPAPPPRAEPDFGYEEAVPPTVPAAAAGDMEGVPDAPPPVSASAPDSGLQEPASRVGGIAATLGGLFHPLSESAGEAVAPLPGRGAGEPPTSGGPGGDGVASPAPSGRGTAASAPVPARAKPGPAADPPSVIDALIAEKLRPGPARDEAPGPFGVGDAQAEAKARALLILQKLKRTQGVTLAPVSHGVVRVGIDAFKKAKLDFTASVRVFSEAGLIEPVEGRDIGIDPSGDKSTRHVLVRVDIQLL